MYNVTLDALLFDNLCYDAIDKHLYEKFKVALLLTAIIHSE
jgi:hypothetical protein